MHDVELVKLAGELFGVVKCAARMSAACMDDGLSCAGCEKSSALSTYEQNHFGVSHSFKDEAIGANDTLDRVQKSMEVQ